MVKSAPPPLYEAKPPEPGPGAPAVSQFQFPPGAPGGTPGGWGYLGFNSQESLLASSSRPYCFFYRTGFVYRLTFKKLLLFVFPIFTSTTTTSTPPANPCANANRVAIIGGHVAIESHDSRPFNDPRRPQLPFHFPSWLTITPAPFAAVIAARGPPCPFAEHTFRIFRL